MVFNERNTDRTLLFPVTRFLHWHPPRDILAPLDMQAGQPGGVVCYPLPSYAMTLTNPPAMVAVKMAHLVQKAVPVLVFRPVPEEGNLDADAATAAPVELAELATGVVERNLHPGEFATENSVVELVEPDGHLFNSRFHQATSSK